jgi:hypothetical protein
MTELMHEAMKLPLTTMLLSLVGHRVDCPHAYCPDLLESGGSTGLPHSVQLLLLRIKGHSPCAELEEGKVQSMMTWELGDEHATHYSSFESAAQPTAAAQFVVP